MADGLFPAVACLQFPIVLGEVERNLSQVRHLLMAEPPSPHTLVVLPEIWATGFDYPRTLELGQRTPKILATMQELASAGQFYLVGSLTAPDATDALPRNTLFLVGPDGVAGSISKQHLFRFWQEDQHYQGGQAAPLISTSHGPLGGLICYDLRFPEVAKRQAFAGGRLLVISAQWPLSRLDHWQTLVRARAIENQCYIAACNGCGLTGSLEMAGHSMIIAPDGQVLQQAGLEADLITMPLHPEIVDEQRRRFFPAGDRPWLSVDKDKIVSLEQLTSELSLIRRHGSRVAFTYGDFDILNTAHVNALEEARRSADCLVVGLKSKTTAQEQNATRQPVNNEADRARVLAALGCVDYVVLFHEKTPEQLIAAIRPDVLAAR
ncbi:MAG: adenylyltransferase/cytidyltransferase family protein [Desulfobulbus sp.]|nr:adenylyltransferase/cytidyltransferase family protein [Desulfobulbus sp.]